MAYLIVVKVLCCYVTCFLDPNQAYYGAQPGYPPQQPYPGAMPPQGYPGAMPPQGYPGAMPPQGFPAGGYPSQGAGFMQPPPYGHNPGSDIPPMGQPQQPGKHENTPLTNAQHGLFQKIYLLGFMRDRER